jgi:thiosulfate/3-mercaptopyruvate sulfurtransferase
LPRYVVIGAGAIGVSFAAELKRAGNGVVLIARGAQLAAARGDGITYARPDGARTLDVPVYGGPGELELRHDDILILATKTQDAADALATWASQPVSSADGTASTAGASLALVTTQNGLETERIALRFFAWVIGGVLGMPAHFVEPGVVVAAGTPAVGVAWLGVYPDGPSEFVEELARTLRRANFDATAVEDISAWKRGKLLASATFVLDALYAPGELRNRAAALLRDEAADVLGAVGEVADLAGAHGPKGGLRVAQVAEVPGYAYGGTSTWQSLARSGSLETDYINGEVVLQARLQGRSAPANAAITAQIHAAADQGLAPRSLDEHDLLTTFPQLAHAGETGARARVLIDADALAAELASPAAPALLDVRWKLGDPDGRLHYAAAHLPAAVYVDLDTELAGHGAPTDGRHPLPDLETFEATARRWGLRQGQPVVIYDDNGGASAARAWWLLRWAGVDSVRILDGGLGAWSDGDRPLEHGIPAELAPGDVNLSPGHLPVLDIDAAADFPATGVLLDARAGERYRGETEPVDPRAGHIPGAVSAPTTENLGPDTHFLPDAALRDRFAALGADAGTPVGVYCGSGVTAAHEIAALAVLGIDAALYPGSWSAWSNHPARPVATGATPEGDPTSDPTSERSASYAG